MRKWFWRVVFWFKHRGGFIDFDRDCAVHGRVVDYADASLDGDITFQLRPTISEFLYFAGERRGQGDRNDLLHCEVPPWAKEDVRDMAMALAPGDYVVVIGRLAFDGVHHGHGLLYDILACIFGARPNTKEGWLEIHPVHLIAKAL